MIPSVARISRKLLIVPMHADVCRPIVYV